MALQRPISGFTLLAVLAMVLAVGVGDASTAQLTASWTDNSDGSAAFEIFRRTQSDASLSKLADIPAGYDSYVDPDIAEGVTYCYRVRAYNAFGSSPYSEEACGSVASSAFKVTISKAGTGSGLVASAPTGILCGTDCDGAYAAGRVVFLTATPSAGSRFVGWSGGCSGTKTCTVSGNTTVSVTATFSRL